MLLSRAFWTMAALAIAAVASQPVAACALCCFTEVSFAEEIADRDVVIVATVVEPPLKMPGDPDDDKCDHAKWLCRVDYVLKGKKRLAVGADGKPETVRLLYQGDLAVGSRFLLVADIGERAHWAISTTLTAKAVKYLQALGNLPSDKMKRLAFFHDHLHDCDSLVAEDAYRELSRAEIADLKALKPQMRPSALREWLGDPEAPHRHQRLYFTMLGICDQRKDLPMLEEIIKTSCGEKNPNLFRLEPAITAYLSIAGTDGLALIDERIMAKKEAAYTDIYSAVMALRFVCQDEHRIERARVLKTFERLLDRLDYADLIIPDLARWQDWSAIERLVELFKTTGEENAWIRVPVIQYLNACPLPKAKGYIAELEKIDPEAVRRANFILARNKK